MGIMGVLFNPNGRIQANQFWQGIIVLAAYLIIVNIIGGFLPTILTTILGLSIYLLPYPYLCVYGKRLHDSGKTAWLYLPFFIAFLIMFALVVSASPGFSDFLSVYMEAATAGEDPEVIQSMMEEFMAGEGGRAMAIRALIYLIIINLVFGFFVSRMFSDPNTNKHGPPVGGEVAGGGQASDDDIFS